MMKDAAVPPNMSNYGKSEQDYILQKHYELKKLLYDVKYHIAILRIYYIMSLATICYQFFPESCAEPVLQSHVFSKNHIHRTK